jgi:unsaturated chondroitin disaccharide hydrolase
MQTTTRFPLEIACGAIISRAHQAATDNVRGFPHFADMDTGAWTYSTDGDWTGGFFVGQLWLAAAAGLGDPDLAARWAERLRPRAGSDTVFRGFLFWYGAALGSELCDHRRNREIALRGALGLAASFNPRAGLLPLGSAAEEAHSVGPGETNIDGVPGGAPLLYWAAALTGEDSLREMARSHVARHVEFLVRPDGSTAQSATFDPDTGALIKTYTHKGVTDDSTWARAQAWAMLGLAQAARHDRALFSTDATKVCDWWCRHLPPGRVAYWDFDAPAHEAQPLLDTSATSIAAAALLKMRSIIPDRAEEYGGVARDMVTAVVDRHVSRSADCAHPAGIVGDGCYNKRIGLATRNELVWGTYFLLEALLTLTRRVDASNV